MNKTVLLLLPGLMCDAAVWRAQVDAFQSDVDVRIPNFHGLDSFDAMARAALALTDGPFAVAGHSMGGRVAMLIAAKFPGRVQRLGLLDTAANLPTDEERARRLGLVELGEREGIEAVIQEWLPPMIAPDRLGDKALWEASAAMIRRAGVASLKSQQKALLDRPDGFAQLDTVKVPTAFITGALDSWSPVEGHQEMQAHVPGSTLTVIESCGHMAPMEAPDQVNRAMAEWLERPA
jgi:pimeloyl-ACP methyl ester carboxylesterase